MFNKKYKIIISIFLVLTLMFNSGFTKKTFAPQPVYRVYLKGKSLGIISSKEELEEYINKKQAEVKQKYGVEKVYLPSDLDVIKEITFSNKLDSIESIYEKIKDISPFTISGYAITIRGEDTQDSEGKTVKGQKQTIYVLDKEVFTESVVLTAKSFISSEEYDSFANETQKEIEDTGKIIEKIYIENKITIKKQNIPINKTI